MFLHEVIVNNRMNDRVFAFYKDESITYRQLHDVCYKYYEKISVPLTGTAMVFLPNSIDFVIAFFTACALKMPVAPIGYKVTNDELLRDIVFCDVSLVFVNSKSEKRMTEIAHLLKTGIDVFNIETGELSTVGNDSRAVRNCLDDTALIIHTSGSTSSPKRAMLTHKNVITSARTIASSLKITHSDTTLVVMPLYLVSALVSQLILHAIVGGSVVILEQPFLKQEFFNIMQKFCVTNTTVSPSVLRILFKSGQGLGGISDNVKIGFAGAPTPTSFIKEYIELYPAKKFIHMYGQTEASSRIAQLLSCEFASKVGSVGKPLEGISIKVLDESGAECRAGVIGEIVISGPVVFGGYYKNEYATTDVLKNNWLYTGDLGYLDEDGYLYISGRKKNIIISGGMNIYPEEIEEVLNTHPQIDFSRVFGENDELLGEQVCAEIVINDVNIRVEEIYKYCRKKLSSYKCPTKIRVVQKIPTTPTGKISRRRWV